jgi:curved DNA-binding protein CbpA
MSQNTLKSDIVKLLTDPFAVLGVSIKADERQILKRYHVLAKRLHPDNYIMNVNNNSDQELASLILTRLVNPAYQQLKQEKKRNEVLSTLRFKASDLNVKEVISLQQSLNIEITEMSIAETEFFYEQAVASYASAQCKSLPQFIQITKRNNQLNLFFLSLQNQASQETQTITEPELDSSTSLVPVPQVKVIDLKLPEKKKSTDFVVNYAQRHYERAIEYQQQGQFSFAVKELRDAIKLEPNNSDHYALLGVVHLQQNFPGMAKVYIRQALKLNSQHPLAIKYAKMLNIDIEDTSTSPKSMVKALGIASVLSRFLSGKQ